MSRFLKIRGYLFPNISSRTKESIEGTMDYVPKDGDIIVASYPKTGTTWLQYIVIQITSKGDSFPPFNDIFSNTFMDIAGAEGIDRLDGLRIYKHHYRYDMVKKNPKSKILYIYRNPEDTFVSYFHFLEDIYQKRLNPDDLFEGFITGNIEYGSYFEHILSYIKHKDDDNLLLISYEKLHANPEKEILRIAKFLGEEYYQDLSTDEILLNNIVNNTSFEYMKHNLICVRQRKIQRDNFEKLSKPINLFRKGIIGDGRNFLSEKNMKLLREKSSKALKGTEILKEWNELNNNIF